MALDELKKDLMNAETDMRSYIENSEEYLKLKLFKFLMRSVTETAQLLLIGVGILFAMLFFSFAASLALSEALDNYYGGFIIVGSIYTLTCILLYIFRKRLNSPILKKFSTYYFE